ncbi:dTDP-4-dehydrorhamnose 3,5-epimerase [Pluralibacter gergoviae]
MNIVKTDIKDIIIIEPKVFGDERGFFFESYNNQSFEKVVDRSLNFTQDNHSRSVKGVLRGLHYQMGESAQAKLVRCIHGEVFDVAVDIRKNSPTFKKWVGVILSAENKRQLWIPEGFAHGFLVLSDIAEFVYKTNNYYDPLSERSIKFDDPDINIKWPETDSFIISRKDQKAPFLNGISLAELF